MVYGGGGSGTSGWTYVHFTMIVLLYQSIQRDKHRNGVPGRLREKEEGQNESKKVVSIDVPTFTVVPSNCSWR